MDSQSRKKATTAKRHRRDLADSPAAGGAKREQSPTPPFANSVRILTEIMHVHEGDELLRLLATNLAQLCGTSYCVFVKFDQTHAYIGSTLAFVQNGKLLDNLDYDVRGTPCEEVHGGEFCYHDSLVQSKFPNDAMLVDLRLEAYMGIPLIANDGRILGLIALLHESTFTNSGLAESLLRIVASRAASELERRDIEQMLQSEQVRFSSVFENARDAIFLHDVTGAIVDANRQACLNLGYERHELIGRYPMAFDPDATPEQLRALAERLKLGEQITFESRHRHKDGEIFPVEIRLRSYRREGARFGVTIAIDLRERRAAAAALQAAEQRLGLVFDAAQVGFWEWNSATDCISFSDQWRQQLGYPEQEVSVHSEVWLSRIHPEDLSALLASLEHFRHSTQEVHQLDLRVRHANGEWRWIHARGRALRDEYGVPYKFVGLHLDDTARKRAEFALNHQKNILERIAKGESCQVILEAIVDYVESQVTDSLCSILRLKDDRLYSAAGDRLPSAYNATVDGLRIGPNVGSCGSAAYRAQPVIVEDIANDPLWIRGKLHALPHGLKSCWSFPILSGKVPGSAGSFGQVIGTFAIYSSSPRKPSESDLEFMNNAVYLAGIAIERAATEEALRDSEARLAAVISNSPGVGIQWYDSEGYVVLWNRASEQIFGYTEAEAIGVRLDKLIHTPEEFEQFLQACAQIAQTGNSVGPVEFTFRRRNGEPGVCLSTLFPIPGRDGNPYFVCMDVDITERKHSEESVRQSREMLQLILDNIPQGVLWKDRESRYVGMNATVRRAMGVGTEDCGKSDLDFNTFTREQAEFFMAKDREVMERDRPQYQILEPMNVATGQTIWLNTNKIPLHDADGKVNGVLVTWEDFTEKRKSQELLQRNMMLLRKTQSMAKMSGWSYDVANKKFSNADESSRILPQRASEMSTEEFQALIHSDDRARVVELWANALAGDSIEMEYRLSVNDEMRWIAIRAEPQRDETGELVSILGVAQDITDRKRLETQLLQSQKYEGLGVLAGGIAHEFNNILTSVLGNAELGLMNLPLHSPAAPIFSEIGKAARRAAGLTKQMLAYSGRGQMEVAPVRLDAIIQEASPFLLSLTTNKAELEFRLQPALASGDAVQLRQVAIQLASNALEALEGLSGRIVIQTGEVVLSESDLAGDYAQPPRGAGLHAFLQIADTGCGMTSEVASKIFDPFFSTKFAGRGLGLAAVLGIVKRHSGGLLLKTAPGKGTTIRVLLPRSAKMQFNNDASWPTNRESRGPMILLIEDEPSVRDFLSQLLTGAGYLVASAGDGIEGIELANRMQSTIQVVLLDIVMPKLDGWAAFDELRRMLPGASIVVMSGYDNDSDANHASRAAKADAFLHKPFRPAQLFAVIKKAITAHSGV